MTIKLGKWTQFWLGLGSGIIAISVVSEAVVSVGSNGFKQSVIAIVTWIGRFRWLSEYQTLLTGAGAVGAAFLSIKAVRDQIESSDEAVKRQIAHAESIEEARKEARRSANRAVLPLTLASLSQYAETNAQLLEALLTNCVAGSLPRTATVPRFASVPTDVIEALKEMVETLPTDQRQAFSLLLVAIQVESSRLNGLGANHQRGTLTLELNLQSYVLGQASIYARAASLYEFGRGVSDEVRSYIKRREVASALFLLGLHSIRDDLEERFSLNSDQPWPAYGG